MTSKTLTDPDGDTLDIYPWRSGRVSLLAREDGKHAAVGPFDPADLIAAIRKAAGGTNDKFEPAPADLEPSPLDAAERELQDLRTALVDWKDAWREERARAATVTSMLRDALRTVDGDA